MSRQELLTAAKSACSDLQETYPNDRSLASVITQLEYLMDLDAGRRDDAERLKDITIAILTTREIEQLDDNVAKLLYEVSSEVNIMKREWSAKGMI